MTEPTYTGEVIDLRELILTLWRRKWLILGATLLVGLLAFIISGYLVPERFQASAIITITDRNTWVALEAKSMPQLAESDELRKLTFEHLGITDLEGERLYELSAETEVRSQLILQVTAEDPDLAAEAANVWAGVVSERINTMYGVSEDNLTSLEEEISQAWTRYAAAQDELEDFLSESRLGAYPAQLSAAQAALAENLLEIEHNQLLISDIQTLAAQLESMAPAETLNTGIALSLINLQARATAAQEILPLQNQVNQTTLSLDEAAAFLQLFNAALENQNQQLADAVAVLEDEISDTSRSLEIEKDQEAQLKLDRDLALGTCESLEADLEEVKILLTQEEYLIMISARALPPKKAISPDVLEITIFAGVSTALLTILGSFFHAWWVGRDDD